MHETESHKSHYRRTIGDVAAEFAVELADEDNLVGRARHEPGGVVEYIDPSVEGIEYERTTADVEAEQKSEALWKSLGQ